MIKTFIFGIVLGVVASVAALLYVPLVDQQRERSIISVQPNGGNVEVFHANVPIDRIMIGAPAQPDPLPPGLDWPLDVHLAGVRTELFKIRNSHDVVIGIASRVAAVDPDAGDVVEWVLHFPARGSAYVTMQPEPVAAGLRQGVIRAGTREFAALDGVVNERFVADPAAAADTPAGRIELTALLVAQEAPPE
ncbi:MAG: hypothetical protein R3315_01545 [Woeseiaceae bacterium]|nr:hypothetical protein [Woeseiaceae bacterium]